MQDEGDLHAVYDMTPQLDLDTPLEAAARKLVLAIRHGETRESFDHCVENLDEEIARSHAARLVTPRLLEVTGNVEERELAARHMEQKSKVAREFAARDPRLRDAYDQMVNVFTATAQDFREGLHLPEIQIDGRVIPYNDTNDTGLRHETGMRTFFVDVHARNVKAGWWSDIETGERKKRNVGELLMLFVTEIAEGYLAWANDNERDDKLRQYPGLGVEMADLGIRWADFCGAMLSGSIIAAEPSTDNPAHNMFQDIVAIAMRYDAMRKTPEAVGAPETADFLPAADVAEMIDAKLSFNAQRPDHKIENRLKEDGKRT
jgi:hypothetical protein